MFPYFKEQSVHTLPITVPKQLQLTFFVTNIFIYNQAIYDITRDLNIGNNTSSVNLYPKAQNFVRINPSISAIKYIVRGDFWTFIQAFV